jgi:hypothetical protein
MATLPPLSPLSAADELAEAAPVKARSNPMAAAPIRECERALQGMFSPRAFQSRGFVAKGTMGVQAPRIILQGGAGYRRRAHQLSSFSSMRHHDRRSGPGCREKWPDRGIRRCSGRWNVGSTAQPTYGFSGIPPSAIVHAVPDFI